MRRLVTVGLAIVAVLSASGFVACAKESAPVAAAPKGISEFFPIRVGHKVVRMQLAILESEQEHGLMDRRDLGDNDGMIFVYAKPQQMHFWMHDTPTALDIGYFDADGVLREIYPMEPFDESTISSRSSEIKFPLEMKQGWFSANGVRSGAKLDLKGLATALKARGFDPAKFGLAPDGN